jgi:hypothetical protein
MAEGLQKRLWLLIPSQARARRVQSISSDFIELQSLDAYFNLICLGATRVYSVE